MNYDYLKREILEGNEFKDLIPDNDCPVKYNGSGDTFFSIKVIQEAIKKGVSHTEKVAEALKESSLIDCVANIKWFAFNHFQYSADADAQMIRLPACAWKQRFSGIDCKSYTVIAGCLLENMGISYYIRKISQPSDDKTEEDNYSHVYVIVPIDQEKGDLQKGYYTIDGTLSHNNECEKVKVKDYFMKHYTLGKPNQPSLKGGVGDMIGQVQNVINTGQEIYGQVQGTVGTLTQPGVASAALGAIPGGGVVNALTGGKLFSIGDQLISNVGDLFSGKMTVSTFFKSLGCLGGTAFNETKLNEEIAAVTDYLNFLVNEFNKNVANLDAVKLKAVTTEMVAFLASMKEVYTAKGASGSWNYCTTENTKTMIKYGAFLQNVLAALGAYSGKYFNKTQSGTYNYNPYTKWSTRFWWAFVDGVNVNIPLPVYNLSLKSFQDLPAFEINAFLSGFKDKPETFTAANAQEYLNTLDKVLVRYQANGTYVATTETTPTNTGSTLVLPTGSTGTPTSTTPVNNPAVITDTPIITLPVGTDVGGTKSNPVNTNPINTSPVNTNPGNTPIKSNPISIDEPVVKTAGMGVGSWLLLLVGAGLAFKTIKK